MPGRPNRTWLSLNLDAGALATDAVQDALPRDLGGIVIEITEQELPPDDEALQRILADLRERGAKIALDDAGAGYAGLQHVVRIRPDIIKLDRSLVRGVDDDAERLALIESFAALLGAHGRAAVRRGDRDRRGARRARGRARGSRPGLPPRPPRPALGEHGAAGRPLAVRQVYLIRAPPDTRPGAIERLTGTDADGLR